MRIIGSFNNGAVGTALSLANGIQALDRSRQVIIDCAVVPDELPNFPHIEVDQ
jgi:hypothetical protein